MIEKNPKAFRSEIYTSFGDLEEEIKRRWNDKKLRKKVKDFFGPKMLSVLSDKPRAILSRNIGTPNLEVKHFVDLAGEIKLDPLILEYNDKFVAKNRDKYYLCRLFFSRTSKNHKTVSADTLKTVDFNKYEGKYFNDIKTVWGESIVDFHHKLLQKELPELKGKIFNFSEWFDETRKLSKYYYLYYLSLFICHGILFENFLIGDKQELSFIEEKFLPSFREVKKIFGVKPLIYPPLPFKNEKSLFWLSYPEKRKKNRHKDQEKKNKLTNYLRHRWHDLSNLAKK